MWSKNWVQSIRNLPRRAPRITLFIQVFLIPFCIVAIAADYVGFFGIKVTNNYVLHEVHLRPFDRDTGSPIEEARARCFQLGSWNACTQKESRKPGRVIVKFSGTRTDRHTLFFDKGSELSSSEDPKIQIMLLHVDYVSEVKTINIDEHLMNPRKEYKVTMKSKGWGESEPDEVADS